MNVADFDRWREQYDQLSYADQLVFYNQVELDHPLQRAFDVEAFSRFFVHVMLRNETVTVIELGGWKGELAQAMLGTFSGIRRWLNYEISQEAVNKSICFDPRYDALIPSDFAWNIELAHADVFVSSHTIEHIRASQFEALIDNLPASIRYVGLQAPLGDEATDWANYYGSHILEIGWTGITRMLKEHGYTFLFSQGEFGAYES